MKHLRRLWTLCMQGRIAEALARRMGRLPGHAKVRWHGADSESEAIAALSRRAQLFCGGKPSAFVLTVGRDDGYHQRLDDAIRRRGIRLERCQPGNLPQQLPEGLAAIVCALPRSRDMTALAAELATAPAFAGIPFEYAAGLDPERAQFQRLDEYRETFFQSPVLTENPTPYALYEESLRHFEQKCGLRDYLDLYQWIKSVVERNVPGDIAEFGSYKGHSGWLIARTLQALGSDKILWMFDAFEAFPAEPFGLDHYWSNTHAVRFDDVQRKLSGFPNVRLIKGDFTQTIPGSGLADVALAYVDCDSYRATKYLIEALWPQQLVRGGVLICEDYGHPALLGNRVAVHEAFEGKRDAVRFFSQFSGYYIAVKI